MMITFEGRLRLDTPPLGHTLCDRVNGCDYFEEAEERT